MDEGFIHALETGNWEHLTEEQILSHFPMLLTEWKRLHGWASRCLGTEISNWGGPKVDPEEGA